SGPYPETRICTTLGETFLMSASTDSFSLWRVSADRSCVYADAEKRTAPAETARKAPAARGAKRQSTLAGAIMSLPGPSVRKSRCLSSPRVQRTDGRAGPCMAGGIPDILDRAHI